MSVVCGVAGSAFAAPLADRQVIDLWTSTPPGATMIEVPLGLGGTSAVSEGATIPVSARSG